jgi:hypothetical protein
MRGAAFLPRGLVEPLDAAGNFEDIEALTREQRFVHGLEIFPGIGSKPRNGMTSACM